MGPSPEAVSADHYLCGSLAAGVGAVWVQEGASVLGEPPAAWGLLGKGWEGGGGRGQNWFSLTGDTFSCSICLWALLEAPSPQNPRPLQTSPRATSLVL